MNNKRFDWTKKEYLKLADAVNAFTSETVQLKIIERLTPMIDSEYNSQIGINNDLIIDEPNMVETITSQEVLQRPGATMVINDLFNSGFFTEPKSLAVIVARCCSEFNAVYRNTDISGILLRMVNLNKLERITQSGSKGYLYVYKENEQGNK